MAGTLPLFPLGAVLFPGMILPLHIFEVRYRLLFHRRVHDDPIFGIVLTRSGSEVGDEPEIHGVGTSASLLNSVRYSDGRFDVVVRGRRRFRVLEHDWSTSYLVAGIEWIDSPDVSLTPYAPGARRQALVKVFENYLEALELVSGQSVDRGLIDEFDDDPVQAGYEISTFMSFSMAHRQHLLEQPTPDEFLHTLLHSLRRERELLLATGIGGAVRRDRSMFLAN